MCDVVEEKKNSHLLQSPQLVIFASNFVAEFRIVVLYTQVIKMIVNQNGARLL